MLAAQPLLGCPGPRDGGRRHLLLAGAEPGPDRGAVLVGPSDSTRGVRTIWLPALARCPRRVLAPEEYSLGTSPHQDMNVPAVPLVTGESEMVVTPRTDWSGHLASAGDPARSRTTLWSFSKPWRCNHYLSAGVYNLREWRQIACGYGDSPGG